MDTFMQYMLDASKYALIVLSVVMIVRCIVSLFSVPDRPEVWGYLRFIDEELPLMHWENLVGRAFSCDVRIKSRGAAKLHAVIRRRDNGEWRIYNIFSKSEISVNGESVGSKGLVLRHRDKIMLGNCPMIFRDITAEQRKALEEARASAPVFSQFGTLMTLTIFQLVLLAQHAITAEKEYLTPIALGFVSLICLQWACYNAMRLMDRQGFEAETIAFYLTTLGMSVAASSTPEDIYKQIILIVISVALFMFMGWWLRSLRRTVALRLVFGMFALALLAVNVAGGEVSFGARNWLEIGGYSFQPSEFVKVLYVYVGAATLDSLYRSRNLYAFIVFSAACVGALALIGDFGTALIFFVCFLVISFMRSGSMATVLLAISGVILAGFLIVTVKPYVAQRFATWGHAWEDIYDKGFQQTRAMSAAASGGLFGKGAGAGWLKDIFAANTDMVFAIICEELGLITALCMVLAVLSLAFFAARSTGRERSAYYAIAACASVTILLMQLALNVFGSLDLLPFTGVTFPFVSRGGSSLMSCWMLMAFIKAADMRPGSSFAVKRGGKFKTTEADLEEERVFDDIEAVYSPAKIDEEYEDIVSQFRVYDPESFDDGEDEWEVWRP